MAPLTELFGFPPSGTISPSVRLLETDYSYYNAGTSFSKSALVGFASKGPINEPTQVFSHEELYRKFGYPDPKADHGSYLLYAAIEFLKYGTEAWILRVGATDEQNWNSFAKTAYAEVNASGTAAVIKSLGTYTNGDEIPSQVVIEKDVNDKFRFSVNGALYNRIIQIPAGTYNLVPGNVPADTDLVDQFNILFTNEDGIEAYTDDDKIAFRTTKIFGNSASIELISVEDAIYETIGIGKGMTVAKINGSNIEWPGGSDPAVEDLFYFGDYEGMNPNLEVRVSGTGNPTIDNVTQRIPFDELTDSAKTAQEVIEHINSFIDDGIIPGGFRADFVENDNTFTSTATSIAGGSAEIDFASNIKINGRIATAADCENAVYGSLLTEGEYYTAFGSIVCHDDSVPATETIGFRLIGADDEAFTSFTDVAWTGAGLVANTDKITMSITGGADDDTVLMTANFVEKTNAVALYTCKRYTDLEGNVKTTQGLTTDGINLIKGKNAIIQVRFQSRQVDTILGFDNNAVSGTFGAVVGSPSSAAFIDGDTVSGVKIDEIGKTIGYNYTAGEQPLLLTLWAESPGLAGNNTQVQVAVDADGLISIIVYNNGIYVESHSGLNLDFTATNNPYYIEQWINGFSDYLYVEHETSVSGLPITGTYNLGQSTGTSGSDGYPYDGDGLPDTTAIDALVIGSTQLGTGLNALAEPEKIDIDLVAVPAINSTPVINALIELCSISRRDCMAIIDSPASLSSVDVRKWHNGAHALNTKRLDSSYAALYWPWVKIRDSQNAVDVWVPPTGSILGVYANSERISNTWAAPAGLRRGTIPTILEVETYAYLSERDLLYGNRNAVNVIVPFPVEGPTVWGQKTLQRNSTALDRVNVRRLMLYLEKNMKIRSRFLIFEPHDDQLRSEFVRIATNLLNEVERGRGIQDFIIKCDDEINTPEVVDRNELRAKIGIQPVKTAEFIFIEFTIHRTGSFEESSI